MESLAAVLALHACLFVVALIFVLISKLPSRQQKLAQTLFSALLPIAGPLITSIHHVSERRAPGRPIERYL